MDIKTEKSQNVVLLMEKKMDDITSKNRWIKEKKDKLKELISTKNKLYDSDQLQSGCDCQIKNDPVFITARFRSGSTFLWQFFRSIGQVTAFYEPLHENLLNHVNVQTPVQDSHVGVKSYWDEYLSVNRELKLVHKSEFGYWKLLLEEDDDYPELNNYIRYLVNSCDDTCPVLQFNRIDFRLPWIRKNFPEAKIVHLYRNPRDQWYSMVKGDLDKNVLTPDINTNYDLLLWTITLSRYFPFLTDSIESSYERHYYIWKLSEIMGMRCSDVSIDYDNEIQKFPQKAVDKIKSVTELKNIDQHFISNIVPAKTGLWKNVKPDEWFDEVESKCNVNLKKLGLIDFFGEKPLSDIVDTYKTHWEKLVPENDNSILKKMVSLYIENRGELAVFASKVNNNLNELVRASNEVGENSKKIVDLYVSQKNKHKQ